MKYDQRPLVDPHHGRVIVAVGAGRAWTAYRQGRVYTGYTKRGTTRISASLPTLVDMIIIAP